MLIAIDPEAYLNDKFMMIAIRGDIKDVRGNPMPEGMADAQGAHVAVMASAKYMQRYISKGYSVDTPQEQINFETLNRAQQIIDSFVRGKFTKIVLRCRDQKELFHVKKLADEKKLVNAYFEDENFGFYGHNGTVITALAIGPYPKEVFEGVTDYLPLW